MLVLFLLLIFRLTNWWGLRVSQLKVPSSGKTGCCISASDCLNFCCFRFLNDHAKYQKGVFLSLFLNLPTQVWPFFTVKRKLANIEGNDNFDFIKISWFIMLIWLLFIREFQIDNLTEPNQLLTPLTRTDDKNAAAAAFQSLTKAAQIVGYDL